MSHSPIGPSTSSYWAPSGACTGFVKMAANYPEDSSITGRNVEGTVAHNIGEAMLDALGMEDFNYLVDTLDPTTGTLITSEMVEAAAMYADDVLQFWASVPEPEPEGGADGESELVATYLRGAEKRLTMTGIHPDMYGTADGFLVDFTRKRITVWDFKFGFGVVEAFENWQLICYVYGVAAYMATRNASVSPDWDVELRIVQPRAYHEDGPKRSWTTTVEKLQPYFERLKLSALEVMGEGATCRTGKYCRNCPARHACPALQANATSAADYSTTPTPELLTGAAIGIELSILTDAKQAIENRLSGLEEQAEQAIQGGERIPSWSIQRSKGREKWTEPDLASSMATMLGIDITKKAYLTPNQARGAGLSSDIVAKYSERGAGTAKLKQDSKNKLNRIFNS